MVAVRTMYEAGFWRTQAGCTVRHPQEWIAGKEVCECSASGDAARQIPKVVIPLENLTRQVCELHFRFLHTFNFCPSSPNKYFLSTYISLVGYILIQKILWRSATIQEKIVVVISPQNYFDILHNIGNVKKNVKDKLFRLGRSPHVPIWWDLKHIKIVEAVMLKICLPPEARKK